MLEGGRGLEQGVSLGLFIPNTVEAKDRSAGLPSALPQIGFGINEQEVQARTKLTLPPTKIAGDTRI